MARVVLPVAGAIVGGLIGGPVGAQLGWALGSVAGNAIDPQIIKGPTIGDISQQTSQEGGPRPIVYALSPPITGNIIATGDPRIVRRRERQGKGGPKVETESVYRTYAIGIAEGPTSGFARVWRNGTLVYDAREGSSFEGNNAFLEKARFFLGTYTQDPSPDLEAIFGVGTTPAHRGTVYMVVADEDLTDLRGAIPQYVFQIGGGIQETTTGNVLELHFEGETEGSTDIIDSSPTNKTANVEGNAAISTSIYACGHGSLEIPDQTSFVDYPHDTSLNLGTGDFTVELKVWVGDIGSDFNAIRLTVPFDTREAFQIRFSAGAWEGRAYAVTPDGMYGLGASVFLAIADQTTPETWSHLELCRHDGIFQFFVDGVEVDPGTGMLDGPYYGSQSHPDQILTIGPGGTDGIVYLDEVAITSGLAKHTSNFTPLQCSPGVGISLPEVVSDLCERMGADDVIDVSDLDGNVPGFMVTNTYPGYAALKSLSEVFLFDPSNYDGLVHFIHRGGNSVATINEVQMLDDEDELEQQKRGDAISIPRVLHLNYYDVDGGLSTDKQSSERSGDRRSEGEVSLQTAVLMNATEAARVVDINHKILIEDQKGELHFSLPDSFLGLVVTNPIIVQWDGKSERCRIIQCDIQDGYQELRALRDRQSAYTSQVEGIPAAPQTLPPSSVVGPTLIEILDIPLLRDADDSIGLGYYVAISGLLDAWQGATIELSLDGGANYIESSTWNIAAIMGETLNFLADHPAEYPDEIHTLSVRIDTPNGDLLETDLVGMLNRENFSLVGDEVIQFANANESSEGTWDISYFLRGRKGTDSESHAIGSRFVLLERGAIPFVPADLTQLNRPLTFRATSFGATPSSGTVVTMTYVGTSQIERRAAYLMAHLDGSDAVMTWQGVGRLGGGATVAQGAYFIGYRVTITDGVLTSTYDTLNQNLTQDVSGFSSTLTISVQQRNQLTGLGPAIQVIL